MLSFLALVALLGRPYATQALESVLTGTVVRPDGRPIEGALLELRSPQPNESVPRASASSGPDGRFVLRPGPLPDGLWCPDSFLELEAPGLARSRVEHVYSWFARYDMGSIVLYEPVRLAGHVTDRDGRPVVGAEIHAALGPVVAHDRHDSRRAPIAVTAADGTYDCRVLPPGPVTLGASADGFADVVLEVEDLRAGEANVRDFVLGGERVQRIRVCNTRDEPLANATAEWLGTAGDEATADDVRPPFWRGPAHADENGWITLRGSEAGYRGDLLVEAPDHRPELVYLDEKRSLVRLEPVTWIEVVIERKGGGSPPGFQYVTVRDETRGSSSCGNCDQTRLAKLRRESLAVEVLAADRWRIAWNSKGCLVDGGRASWVNVLSTEGAWATAEVPESAEPGATVTCRVEFDEPSRLSGVVRDADGRPVALSLGADIPDPYRAAYVTTSSSADGRFEFERVGGRVTWIRSIDDGWEVNEDLGRRVELAPGATLEGIEVRVHPVVPDRLGRVFGRLTIGGAAPGRPILLALDEGHGQERVVAPESLFWAAADGRFEIEAAPDSYHIVPKHAPPASGWRDFAGEFPAHRWAWPWKVQIPESGTVEAVLDLPLEAEWDAVAPPLSDDDD